MTRASLPDGWEREFEGRFGAEYFYGPRKLTVSVIPRRDRPARRASESAPAGYVVRVTRLFDDRFGRPLTVGERTSMAAAVDLAESYMRTFNDRHVRTDVPSAATDALAAIGDVTETLLVDAVRDALGDALVTLARPDEGRDPGWRVLDAREAGLDAPIDDRPLGDEPTVWLTDDHLLAWLPAGRGLLVVADRDAEVRLPAFVDDLTGLLVEESADGG